MVPGRGRAAGHRPGCEAGTRAVAGQTSTGGLEPGLADTLLRETQAAVERQESQGNAPVLLVSPVLRAPLSRFLRHHLPQLGVLSNTEIPDERMVRVTALIGGSNGP